MNSERKSLKKAARKVLKSNYFKCVILVFIVGFVINGGYTYTTVKYNKDKSIPVSLEKKNNYNVINETLDNIVKKDSKDGETNINGAIAPVVNSITNSKSITIGFLNAINLLVFKNNVSKAIISFLAGLVSLLFYFFVRNVIKVGSNRFFIEQIKNKNVGINRLLFPYRFKWILNLVYVLFIKNLFELLWNITIVGGFIKHYEYLMIQYVIAENPNIKRKEAFSLSKELMYGEKWNTFKLDLSMFGWHILSLFTMGVTAKLYSDPYIECIYAQLYLDLRKKKKENLTYKELLNDKYLTANYYEKKDLNKQKNIPIISKIRSEEVDYNRPYTIFNYIMLFFTFAFIGWIWEVFYHLILSGSFVNRGTMFGPWLPIYGFGGLFMLILLKPLRENHLLFFVGCIVVAGVLEYGTAWYLETFKHMKWWDYTGYFLNIKGRICLEGLFVFALGGSGVTYFIAPALCDLYDRIRPLITNIICVVLCVFFTIDLIYSANHPNVGEGITFMDKNNIVSIRTTRC